MNRLLPFALYRASYIPRSGSFFNAIAFLAMTTLGVAVFFAGLKPWGGIINSAGWAGLIVGCLFILWFILSRISGVLNAIVMIVICWSGFTGRDGAVNHTANIHEVANFIRSPSSFSYSIVTEIGGYKKYSPSMGGDIDVDLVQDYRSEIENSWNNYGTFVNSWYTPEKFNIAWQDFFTWFSDHHLNQKNTDGTFVPTIVPYMGSLNVIKQLQTSGRFSELDIHHDSVKSIKIAPITPVLSQDEIRNNLIISNSNVQFDRQSAWLRNNPRLSPHDFYSIDRQNHPDDYSDEGEPKIHNPFIAPDNIHN